ncbi:putative GntR family transcriptional regulator [Austwickia chelonae NBRC 105200]|uniref:Putative GntR family transcriptional regulator n=1 Tax=Austwickia chelonae NBRC 105200 TaxID=1184607 RepID=K6VNE9_9MICO|nr:putative GntR family transcriptional regulator [Austwickia chelonae NBRC 105200]
MVITLDPGSSVAPYEQIRDQVVEAIVGGALCAGARLPTVRQLAGDLGLAVNTVAKAYKRLEAEGHVATRGRHGTVVLPRRVVSRDESAGGDLTAGGASSEAGDEVCAAAEELVRAARRHGLDLSETIGLLRQSW